MQATEKLLSYILPPELFTYFDIVDILERGGVLHIHLQEQAITPSEYSGDKLISKGFHEEVEIKDFPLRDKAVLLHVRRRRWLNETRGKAVSRNWQLVAEGTHYTQDFASFLKELIGYLPDRELFPGKVLSH